MRWFIYFPLIFFLTGYSVSALTLEFSNTPTAIDGLQDFTVDVLISCSNCNDSYLRGVFYPSGTNYFGFTRNNLGDWINLPSSGISQYYYVSESEFQAGSWSGKLTVKPDIESSAYQGPGSYNFKVGRYTGSGSATWAAAVPINITGPSSTPTPEPTSTNTPVPTHTKTPTKAPTPVPTVIPATKTAPTKTPLTISPVVPSVTQEAEPITNIPTPSTPVVSPTGMVLSAVSNRQIFPWGAFGLVTIGVLMIVVSLVFFFKKPAAD